MKVENVSNMLLNVGSRIQENKYVRAVSEGLLSTMPLMIVGSIGSILNSLDISVYQNFLVTSGLKKITVLPNEVGTNLFALFAVFSIGYRFAKLEKKDGLTAGIISLMAFLFVTPLSFDKSGTMTAIPSQWLGAAGLFGAMIIGLISSKIYCVFIEKNIVIKLPDSVPPVIERTFGAILPSLVVGLFALVISFIFSRTPWQSLHSFIYSVIAQPLTGLGSTFTALLIAVFFTHLLWVLGIHGTMVTLSVFYPIWAALDMQNLAAYNSGQPSPHIVSMQFFFLCAFAGGAGNTLALILNLFFSKISTNKTLAKLAFIPGVFGINEPIIFGMPIVMNPLLAIPFILSPIMTTIIGYICCRIGIIAMPTGISSISGAPIIVNQFLMGGVSWAIWTIAVIIISYVIYFPFVKLYEKKQLVEISQQEQINNVNNIAEKFDEITK